MGIGRRGGGPRRRGSLTMGAPPKAQPLSVQLMTRLTEAEQSSLARLAEREDRTLAAMARLLIREGLAARVPARKGRRA